ncbi:hypothetical protein TNCT_560321 [Trichonephila clavata]|uniref:Uncharacterized protein n=1 Tax=Trichonephila clavata TaxID=2740835 RepID=A0A8X6JNN8_TRICU|nr:hypothetical protein TNCT_560321 [Trichonephila clavata]
MTRWNAANPDRNTKCWHGLRKLSSSLFSRQSSCGSVMTLTSSSFSSQLDLDFLSGRQNSSKYIRMPENNLTLFAVNTFKISTYTQYQDNTPFLISKAAKKFYSRNMLQSKVTTNRPDLNTM